MARVAASKSPSIVIEELDPSGPELETGPLYLFIEGRPRIAEAGPGLSFRSCFGFSLEYRQLDEQGP